MTSVGVSCLSSSQPAMFGPLWSREIDEAVASKARCAPESRTDVDVRGGQGLRNQRMSNEKSDQLDDS